MIKKGFRFLIVLWIILSLIFSIIILPLAALPIVATTSPGLPDVTLELIDPNQTAHVAPGEEGTVEFDGVAHVTKPPGTRVVVSLTAEDTWGSAVVSPSSILFSQNGEQPFTVTLHVPQKESCETIGTVTVTGRWAMYPGGLSGPAEPNEGVEGMIFIEQYYKFTTSVSDTYIETTPGSEVEFKILIENIGNGNDTFLIQLLDSDKLSDKGFKTKLSQVRVDLPINIRVATIILTVDTPSSSSAVGQNTIRVDVCSENGVNEGVPHDILSMVVDIPEKTIFQTNEFYVSISIIILVIIIGIVIIIRRMKKKKKRIKNSKV
jgi:hypothetical protein